MHLLVIGFLMKMIGLLDFPFERQNKAETQSILLFEYQRTIILNYELSFHTTETHQTTHQWPAKGQCIFWSMDFLSMNRNHWFILFFILKCKT